MNDELLAIAGRGEVLVFPTEEAARAFSVQYALTTGKGILASSAVAFDRFASMFYPAAEGRNAASDADRMIFSSYAASVLTSRMRYFISPDYPEVKDRLQPFFKSMLQHLEEAKDACNEAAWDLALLYSEYKGFLEASGLYEPSYIEPVMPELCNEYHILVPAAFPKERRLVEFLAGKEHVHIHEAGGFSLPVTVHQSEIEEIRDVFIQIRALLDQGVPLNDIVITTAGADRLRYQLMEEAFLFDIPLEFVAGASPLSYPAGAFLSGLEDIYTSRYSLSTLKEFFLNPAFPFKDRRKLRAFIRKAIDSSISSAPSKDDDRYRRIGDADGGAMYRLLRFALDLLMTETNPDRVLPMLNQIMTGLLEPGEFNGRKEDQEVYSFAMKELTMFLSKLKDYAKKGYSAGTAVFPLFMSYLSNTRYVPQQKPGGVRVYGFSNDAALEAPYRFLMTLNENDSKKTVKDAAYLSDYELKEKREVRDITMDLLYSYSLFSGRLFLSASYNTYQGFALPLSSLKQVTDPAAQDRRDRDAWGYGLYATKIYPLQHESCSKALATSSRRPESPDLLTKKLPGKPLPLPVPMSFSASDSYAACPFKYALESRFNLSRYVEYDASAVDYREIGTRLHSVMERFFREGGDPEVAVPALFEEEIRLWQDGKEHGRDGLRDMPSAALRPSSSLAAWIKKRYLANLVSLAKELSASYEPVEDGLEKSYSSVSIGEGLSFVLSGRIDMLVRDKGTGGLVLVDYKTSLPDIKKHPEKAEQFFIYSLLLENEYGCGAEKAFFAGFNKSDTAEVEVRLMDKAAGTARLEGFAKGMAAGNWEARPSKEHCSGCRFRSVCRMRFTVR